MVVEHAFIVVCVVVILWFTGELPKTMTPENEIISAEVILKSISGRSLTDDVPITSKNIKEFQPSQETINETSQIISKFGFRVMPSNITITIVGSKSLFEEVFDTNLEIDATTKEVYVKKSDRDLTIPSSLRNLVEKVVFIPPPEYH